jgi:hypothetical protein
MLHAQASLAAQVQSDREAEQYNQAAGQPEPRPSKASLLIDPTDYAVMSPKLDSRFDQVRGSPVGERAFSKSSLRTAILFPAKYPRWDFTLRHPNAAARPIKERCQHWRLADDRFSDPKEAWDIDIKVTGIRANFIACGDTGYSGQRSSYVNQINFGPEVDLIDSPRAQS